jgi:hypothetical protein
LDTKEVFEKIDNNEYTSMIFNMKQLQLLWVDLYNKDFTKEELSNLKNDKEFSDIFYKLLDLSKWLDVSKLTKKDIDNMSNYIKTLSKENLIKLYKASIMWLKKEWYNIDDIIKDTRKFFNWISYDDLWNKSYDYFKKVEKNIIEDRNKIWINIMLKNLWKDKIWVMVYWKAHIPDLMKQLKEKYNGKVNIYVAK